MKRPNTGLEPYSAPGYTAVTYSNDEKMQMAQTK